MVEGKFKVIDAHCHIYPEKIAARAVAGTDSFYGGTSDCLGTVEDLLKEGEAAGIDHFIVQSVATTPKQVTSINEFIAASVAQSGGKMTGLGTVHPESEDYRGDIQRIVSLGLKGIKIHPDIQRFPIDDPGFMRIYELCEREGLIVLMHTGDHRYDYSNPNRLIPTLKAFPDMTVIGAHFGGWSLWKTIAQELAGSPNLYVDSSSALPWITAEEGARLVRAYGADRVLFGTDYPMWSPMKELQRFAAMGLDDEEKEKIFYLNAKKLFKINNSN